MAWAVPSLPVGTFSRLRGIEEAGNTMTESRDELISRAKAGDRSAFDDLVSPLMNQAFRLAYGMLFDREAAHDAVQEAAFRSWRKLGNLRPGSEMRPWFFAIVANQCREAMRGRWWTVMKFAISPESDVGSNEESLVVGADVRTALRRLPFDQREVLVLRYYCDLSQEEVASIVRVPVGTVKSRINRGLAAMRPFFGLVEALI
jgi:RNA polymerase sigma factor (sigma-70 family)